MAGYAFDPLSISLALLAAWALIGLAGLVRPASLLLVGRVLFPLGAVVGAALGLAALLTIALPPDQAVLPIGLPDLPFHLRLDALSAASSSSCSAPPRPAFRFSPPAISAAAKARRPGLLCLQYHLFLASMGFVLLADDAYAFMVAWETMALSSYFLVTTQHRIPEIRRAGFLYLLIAHVGAIAILLSFGVLQGGSWQFTFDAMRGAQLDAGLGGDSPSCSRSSASARRRAWCRCTCGCPKRIRRRPRRSRR